MNRDFYELKYRVIETFYDVQCEENYTYLEAAGRTLVEFYQAVNSKDIESIIVVSTIALRLLKHKVIEEDFIKNVKEVIGLFYILDVKSQLNDEEYEVLCEEITELKIELKL